MLYFSESCVEVKLHHQPSNFAKKKIGNTKTTRFVSINVQFSTRFCDFEVAILYRED
jgi:hypothetical protein